MGILFFAYHGYPSRGGNMQMEEYAREICIPNGRELNQESIITNDPEHVTCRFQTPRNE